jgi:hypothetical protein
MKKREAVITPRVVEWVLSNIDGCAAVEVKHTRGKPTFHLRELKEKEHQVDYLLSAQSPMGFTYKIPDDGTWKPFDALAMKRALGIVAIVYPQGWAAIRIDDLDRSEAKSLSWGAAVEMALFYKDTTK